MLSCEPQCSSWRYIASSAILTIWKCGQKASLAVGSSYRDGKFSGRIKMDTNWGASSSTCYPRET